MPLPTNDPVAFRGVPSLGGNKKMALTMTFTQKQVEALFQRHDALRGSSQCPLEIDFDDDKIYIGEIVTPFVRVKEDGTREICQRSPTVSKPLAGITLAGNVIGKLNIQRDYDQDLANNIRKLTEAEVSKRKEHHIVRLDSPPVMPNGKKSKPGSGVSSLAKKAMANRIVSNQAPSGRMSTSTSQTGRPATPKTTSPNTRTTPSSSAKPSTVGSSAAQLSASSSTPADPDLTSLRSHMIHYLAFDPKTTQDVLSKIGGHNPSPETVREIEEILTTVAEEERLPKNAAPGPVRWQLRHRLWEEIRPYEYGSLSDADRKKLARKGRIALGSAGVENARLWDHFRSDVDVSPTPASAKGKGKEKSTTSRPLVKTSDFKGGMFPKGKTSATKGGGVVSGGVTKKKAANAKSKVKKEQEDEVEVKAQKVVASLDDVKGKGKAGPSASAAGSGTLVNKSRLKEEDKDDDAVPLSAKSRQSMASFKKNGPPQPLKSRRTQDEEGSSKRKLRDADEEGVSEMEEGELPAKPETKKRKLAADNTKSKKPGEKNGIPASKPGKEKEKVSAKDEGTFSKSVRDGGTASRASASGSSKAPAGNKALRLEKEKEREWQEREALDTGHSKEQEREKRRSSVKRARRATPSFSSDEDDEVETKPTAPSRTAKPKALAQPLATSKSAAPTSKVARAPSPVLPTDKEGLRRRYHTCYARYMGVTSKFHEQRAKIEEALLADGDGVSGDDDVGMMDTEQLMQLRGEHERLRDELERIKRAHATAF